MKMKKILASIIAIETVACTFGTGVLAFDIPNTPEKSISGESNSILRYAHISTFTPTLKSNGDIKVILTLRSGNDYAMTLELEQYIGGSWEPIDNWSLDGSYGGTISESCSLESGERYRARAYVEVYDEYGDLVENTTKYSSAVTAR